MKLRENRQGGYRFLSGIGAYSSGVVAMRGFEVIRVTMRGPVPYRDGFDLIAERLAAEGRPRQALCAVELRSPRPFSFAGFAAFNQPYQALLSGWDLLVDGLNPVARTNVAPAIGAPAEPGLHAFCYTVPAQHPAQHNDPTFVVAGAGDVTDQSLGTQSIVRYGETSADALEAKAAHVMQTMESRLSGLELAWPDVTAINIYTAHAFPRGLPRAVLDILPRSNLHGVSWCYSNPPIEGLEYEMDMHGHRLEWRM